MRTTTLSDQPTNQPTNQACLGLTNRYRVGRQKWDKQPLADAHMTVPPTDSTNQTCLGYRVGRQKWEVSYQPQRHKREVYQPQGRTAPSLARKGKIWYYRVGQPKYTFLLRQGFSRGRGRRAAPSLAACAGESQVFSRGWVIHRGVRGVIPLPSLQPTRCRV